MSVFFRINDNKLFSAGEVETLGFNESDGYRIPDDYLEKQEFVVMRTCHGLGDWILLSAMPRLLKEKYPKCKVHLPSKYSDTPGKPVNAIVVSMPFKESYNANTREVVKG